MDQRKWFYWYELGASYSNFPGAGPSPGTVVTAWITYNRTQSLYTLSVNQNQKVVIRDSVPMSGNIIIEPEQIGNDKQTPLANYSQVQVSHCILNGHPFFSYPVTHWRKKSGDLFNAKDTVTATDSFVSNFLNP